MDRLVHLSLALTAAMLVPLHTVVAEEKAEEVSKRGRVVSPHVAEMLAAASPKFDPVPAATGDPANRGSSNSIPEAIPANSIVRLPDYLVRSRKLPAPEEVMSRMDLEKFAMQKYLGDEHGLDRALNMISVAGLWKKIPVLGKYPFIVGSFSGRGSGPAVGPTTNEQRAMTLYEKAQNAQRWEQLQSLLSPQLRPETPTVEASQKK